MRARPHTQTNHGTISWNGGCREKCEKSKRSRTDRSAQAIHKSLEPTPPECLVVNHGPGFGVQQAVDAVHATAAAGPITMLCSVVSVIPRVIIVAKRDTSHPLAETNNVNKKIRLLHHKANYRRSMSRPRKLQPTRLLMSLPFSPSMRSRVHCTCSAPDC